MPLEYITFFSEFKLSGGLFQLEFKFLKIFFYSRRKMDRMVFNAFMFFFLIKLEKKIY